MIKNISLEKYSPNDIVYTIIFFPLFCLNLNFFIPKMCILQNNLYKNYVSKVDIMQYELYMNKTRIKI